MASAKWSITNLLAAALILQSGSALAQTSPVDMIRLSSDGAGPSHIFRIGRTINGNGDLVAIVDPLLSAIRIFEVDDQHDASQSLASRVRSVGTCALPVAFRPWRVHALRDKILIESMPVPGVAGFLVKPENMRSTLYEIDRDFVGSNAAAFASAATLVDTAKWTPATEPNCGKDLAIAGKPYAAAPERAIRGHNNPARTIILRNLPSALAPAAPLTVRSPSTGKFRLISARELEPAGGFRYVLTAEAAVASNGTVNVTQRLIAFSATTGAPIRELRFDPSTIKSKLGQRPIAVLSTGEILVMGKAPGPADVPIFKLFSCGRLTSSQPRSTALCDATQDTIAGRSSADLVPVSQTSPPDQEFSPSDPKPKGSFDSRRIFANVDSLADFPFAVDASQLPEECRVIQGCPVSGSAVNFVPIRGIRLTRGTFTRSGVPYAQADVPNGFEQLTSAKPEVLSAALAKVRGGAKLQPGNLADDFENDAGIDCSGLVQVAWNGRLASARLSTASLSDFSNGLVCDTALPAPEWLEPGDAVVMHTKQVNHVMLFASAMRLDGGNDEWLMLESSSSCDGVCWSVYDPSFFGGWQLRRAKGRSDWPCIHRRKTS